MSSHPSRKFVPDCVASSQSDPLRNRSVLLLRLSELLLRSERFVTLCKVGLVKCSSWLVSIAKCVHADRQIHRTEGLKASDRRTYRHLDYSVFEFEVELCVQVTEIIDFEVAGWHCANFVEGLARCWKVMTQIKLLPINPGIQLTDLIWKSGHSKNEPWIFWPTSCYRGFKIFSDSSWQHVPAANIGILSEMFQRE